MKDKDYIVTRSGSQERQNLVQKIRERLLSSVDYTREMTDEEIAAMVEDEVTTSSRRHALSLGDRQSLEQEVFNSMRKLDVLQILLEDDEITEIMVNGWRDIFYEKNGSIHVWEGQFCSPEKLADTIQQIAAMNNRMVNETTPIVDTRLGDGSRVNIVLSPIAIDGSTICIRKFPKEPLSIDRLIQLGALSCELAEYLGVLVSAGYNIFISGGTGSGKTTFLNALSAYIPKDARLITIEDSAELQIQEISNLVRLEVRNANCSGSAEISIRELIRTALRMRPDRIIIGECRGREALDMLQAMNTGHDGSLSTGHANSSEDMLQRLETMVLMGMDLPLDAIRRQIVSGIDLMVHLGRLRDGSRKVLEVSELSGISEHEICLQRICSFQEAGERDGRVEGEWIWEHPLEHRNKLEAAGLEHSIRKLESEYSERREKDGLS